MIKVFITRKLPGFPSQYFGPEFEVRENLENSVLPHESLFEVVSDYDAVLSTVADVFDSEMLNSAKKLKVISSYATGVDNIDLAVASEKGISVCNTPDIVTDSTADHTLAILLGMVRKIANADNFVRSGKWKIWDPWLFNGEELRGKILGIVGFGKIGSAVALRAMGFGMKICYFDTVEIITSQKKYHRCNDIYELLQTSDIISFHIPLNSHTKGMVNKLMFDQMKKNPLVINTSRGGIIGTNDLAEALKTGKIKGAALDVTDPEPLPSDHALFQFDNLLVTPHIGTATIECRAAMAKNAAINIIKHFFPDGN